MDEIGLLLHTAREDSGVSLKEASADLEIKELILENIEDGNIGCFKDIFALKDYLAKYAKYLGLDSNKIIDSFNEYLFEYTSRIPVDDIEKALIEHNKEEEKKEELTKEIASPYTKPQKKNNSILFILLYIFITVLVILVVVWAVKQITVNNNKTTVISYVK